MVLVLALTPSSLLTGCDFYKYPPDVDGAVTLCVYSSLFLRVCVLANFLHCNKSPTKAPFSAISNEAIYTQQFVPQSFSSVTTDILSDWLNVVNQLKNHEVSMEPRRVNANAISGKKIISQKTFNQRAWIGNNGGRVSLEKAITTTERVIWAIYGNTCSLFKKHKKI